MRLPAIILSLALIGCTTQPLSPIFVSGESLLIRGEIKKETAVEFKREVERTKISRILLASGGGDVEASIEIANVINKRGLDVEVIGDCFSSCANYLFTAGANKVISGLGIVAWHGNIHHLLYLHNTGKRPLDAESFEVVTGLANLETTYFAGIGVDQFICWFGKVEPFDIRNLYFLSVKDMEHFGVRNVVVRSDYEASNVSNINVNGVENLRYLPVDWNTYKAEVPRR